jgi:hypothetical protein
MRDVNCVRAVHRQTNVRPQKIDSVDERRRDVALIVREIGSRILMVPVATSPVRLTFDYRSALRRRRSGHEP